MKATFILREPIQAHKVITGLWEQVKPWVVAGHQLCIQIKPLTRSLEQNSRMWAMLTDVSKQVDWYGRKLTPEEWKHVFTAALKKQDVVPGIDGGFVVLGLSTSQMSIREMIDLMELMGAFGAQNGVRFSAPEQCQ